MPEPSEYTMPPLEPGDPVLYYERGDIHGKPWVGFATRVDRETIQVHLMSPESYNFLIRDGVRHVRDAKAGHAEARENGLWDYHPRVRQLLTLLAIAAELRGGDRHKVPK